MCTYYNETSITGVDLRITSSYDEQCIVLSVR